MADVRTQQTTDDLRDRVDVALTWAPNREGKGGMHDGRRALAELCDRVAALETENKRLREALAKVRDMAAEDDLDMIIEECILALEPVGDDRG